MPFARLDPDTRVHYDIGGNGPPLVLVHGISGRGAGWVDARALLEDRFTVITPDLSGSGDTEDAGGPLTVTFLADEVAAVIESADLGPAHVAGHSVGGVVTGVVAGRHPDRVLSAALHAPWKVTDTRLHALFSFYCRLFRESPRQFTEVIALTSFHPAFLNAFTVSSLQEWIDVLTGGLAVGTDRQLDALLAVDNSEVFAAVRCPSLVVASDHDEIIPADQHRAVLATIPHSREARVPGGHSAPWEAIDTFLEPIVEFIAEVQHGSFAAGD